MYGRKVPSSEMCPSEFVLLRSSSAALPSLKEDLECEAHTSLPVKNNCCNLL